MVPEYILKYCDELEAKVNGGDVPMTASDLAKLAEVQSWYLSYLEDVEPQEPIQKWNLSNDLIENIVERMYA